MLYKLGVGILLWGKKEEKKGCNGVARGAGHGGYGRCHSAPCKRPLSLAIGAILGRWQGGGSHFPTSIHSPHVSVLILWKYTPFFQQACSWCCTFPAIIIVSCFVSCSWVILEQRTVLSYMNYVKWDCSSFWGLAISLLPLCHQPLRGGKEDSLHHWVCPEPLRVVVLKWWFWSTL